MILKKYSRTEALMKLRRYCAYQERSHQEVKKKLYDWGFHSEEIGTIVVQLMEESLLNEERFAKAIAGGKFRQMGWGKKKIINQLKSKGIGNKLIEISLKEIDEDDYVKKLTQLLEKKKATLKSQHFLIQKQKLMRYALTKGYESDLIYKILDILLNGEEDL